ncbi:MarR family transcriptional regulator [Parafrankia sp. FMc6]|uniref:MarR family winged helix-turn-helix transcriptional regulator n=1 Tax=Parafrankia soli TaxID=2599596 RepID=UPI0034D4BFA8
MERSSGASPMPASVVLRPASPAAERQDEPSAAAGPSAAGCPSVAADAELELPDEVRDDLCWIVGQIQHRYLAASASAVGGLPGGLKGFYVLDAAVGGTAHNQIEVARRFSIDRTVMVRLVDEMERAGLVERRPDPADRRARMIIATERGIQEHERVRRQLRAVDDHVLAPLAPADREVFTGLARLVAAHLVAMDPTRGAAACATAEVTLQSATTGCDGPGACAGGAGATDITGGPGAGRVEPGC